MTNPVSVIRHWSSADGSVGQTLYVWCPGCDMLHGPNVVVLNGPGAVWVWNGSTEKPTLSPSVLVHSDGRDGSKKCHSYITEGQWHFLSDCHHALAGQIVDMVPLPDWIVKESND